jgi:hypothetical protein
VNHILGIFNLLPALPLDGGRALRSFLSTRHGKIRGTEKAVKVSNGFALLFGIIGILGFNILLILIALFIYMASKGELFLLQGQSALEGLRAGEVGTRTKVIRQNETAVSVVSAMRESKTTVLPVETISGRPALVTLDKIRNIPRDRWSVTPVSQLLDETPKSIDVDDFLDHSLEDLLTAPAQSFPLTKNGRPIGVVRLSEVMEAAQFRELNKKSEQKTKRVA